MVEMKYGRLPVDRGNITGRWLQSDNGWTPEHMHLGVDFGKPAAVGDNIYWVGPPGKAIVHTPGDGWGDGSFGNCVVFDHRAAPWYTLCAHMSALLVVTGQECKEGDIVGALGFSGSVQPPGPDGAHCHWQMCTDPGFPRDSAKGADPLTFFAAVQPPPPSQPVTVEQALAQALAARDEALAAMNEVKSVNAALQLRWKLDNLARDPDLARVQQAVDALRKVGFNL